MKRNEMKWNGSIRSSSIEPEMNHAINGGGGGGDGGGDDGHDETHLNINEVLII